MPKQNRLFLLHWMSFADDAGLLPEPIERQIAQGIQISESDLARALKTAKMPVGFVEIVRESALLISGQTQLLYNSLCKLDLKPNSAMTRLESVIWAERTFLAGLAEHRLGQITQGYWANLSDVMVLLPIECFFVKSKLDVEKAAMDMNCGRFEKAIESLTLLGPKFCDVYTAARAHGICATSYTEIGRFKEAEVALSKEQKLLLDPVSKSLQLANQCRRISFLIEQELLIEAEALHAKAFENKDWSPNSHALLLKLKIQMGLLKSDTVQVAKDFDDFYAIIERFKIHAGFISVSEEQCAFALLQNSVESMIAELKEIVWQASLRGNKRLECIAKLFTARAQYKMGLKSEAIESLEMSLSIALKNRYEKLRLKILFQLMCIHLNEGKSSEAENLVLQIRPIVQQKRYRILFAGCQYLDALNFMKTGFEGLVVRLKSILIQPQLQALIFTNALHMEVGDFSIYLEKKHILSCGESEALNFITLHEGIFLVGDHVLISKPFDERIVIIQSSATLPIYQILRHFLNGIPLTKALVHSLSYDSTYSAFRHDERIRVAMARSNKDLQMAGFKFIFDKKLNQYTTDCKMPRFTLIAKLNKNSIRNFKKSVSEGKKESILQMIREMKKVTTTEMCLRMQMKRQSLSVYLKELTNEDHVRLIRFGPKSYYVPIDL